MEPMNHPDPGNIYLMSYPRSGSNWFRYCAEFITKRRTHTRENCWNTGASEAIPELIYHLHDIDEYNMNTKRDANIPQIILIRDYKECISSHATRAGYMWMLRNFHAHLGKIPGAIDGVSASYLKRYCDLINEFEKNQSTHPSLIIHYEGLQINPKIVLTRFINYIETIRPQLSHAIPPIEQMNANLQDLMNNYAHHRGECLNAYRGAVLGTLCSGVAASSKEDITVLKYYYMYYLEWEIKRMEKFVYNSVSESMYKKHLAVYEERQ
jgi:hypothetical protein